MGTYMHGDGNSLDSRGGGGNVLLESFAGGCSELQPWGEWAGYGDLHRTADHGLPCHGFHFPGLLELAG